MQTWRYSAFSVTKYNPAYRDVNGVYQKSEWIGFFQVGKNIDGQILTLEEYELTEEKYLTAAYLFFTFHGCVKVRIENLEKNYSDDYKYPDKEALLALYNKLESGQVYELEDIKAIVKLILRELIWAELFCDKSDEITLRFGYDFYMYFNSGKNMTSLFREIESLGLFVD